MENTNVRHSLIEVYKHACNGTYMSIALYKTSHRTPPLELKSESRCVCAHTEYGSAGAGEKASDRWLLQPKTAKPYQTRLPPAALKAVKFDKMLNYSINVR